MSITSLTELKKQSKSILENLRETVDKQDKKFAAIDNRWWTPTVDTKNNGEALIRLLPAPKGEIAPYVRYWDHSFKGPTGKTYWEKSLTSIGQKDPCGILNSKLWNTGDPLSIEQARNQKRREHYVVNILVLNDKGNPENNGKVFL